MRRARITYTGAFHHAMNRGHNGLPIFKKSEEKQIFLDILEKNSKKCKISVLAYCIMDTHYHLLIQNTSGRMSDFFKRINGEYGSVFRKANGGRGYVFQDRYKSSLIQKETYLLKALAYVLNNPVAAGIVNDFNDYQWSSTSCYFGDRKECFIDTLYVSESFENYNSFKKFINQEKIESLPLIHTKVGTVFGNPDFIKKAKVKFNRRKTRSSLEHERDTDLYYDPVGKVLFEFSEKYKIDPMHLDTTALRGKRQRGELLKNLKDRSGLTYKEISRMDIFSDLKFSSLGRLYQDAKKRKY